MNPIRFRRMLGDVSWEFDHPRSILHADGLTAEQKVQLLREWELDLRGLQVASDENMIDENNSGATAELLQACRAALIELDAGDGDSGGAPTKTGAGA